MPKGVPVSYTHLDVYKRQDEFCGLMKHGFIMLAGAIGADLGYDITCPCILLCGEHDKTGATKPVSYTHLDVYKRQK